MVNPISNLFAEAKAHCVDWEGQALFALFETDAPQSVAMHFVQSKSKPPQGLTLKAVGGLLRINEIEAAEMVIWADTAPDQVQVSIIPMGTGVPRLKIWNVWRGKVGGAEVKQAWLGNAGMRIEQRSSGLQACCSDGEGPVNFGDLVVEIEFGES